MSAISLFEELLLSDAGIRRDTDVRVCKIQRIHKLRKKGYSQISVGIGMDYGRALMVKAGYSGSGLNDIIWMGDVVNSACHIANKAGRDGKKTLVVSSCIYYIA